MTSPIARVTATRAPDPTQASAPVRRQSPSPTPPLAPIRSAHRLRILDDGQLADLRAATLEILDTVGVHCPSERARAIYEAHGARVDREHSIVRLPPELVTSAIAMAPRGFTMGYASASTSAPSIPSSSCASGAIAQMSAESGGRDRIVASSPASTPAISTA
jgi:trimethylamine:corrinoid methyltransferase-like protein